MKTKREIKQEIFRKRNVYKKEMQKMFDEELFLKRREELTLNEITRIEFTKQIKAQINILEWTID